MQQARIAQRNYARSTLRIPPLRIAELALPSKLDLREPIKRLNALPDKQLMHAANRLGIPLTVSTTPNKITIANHIASAMELRRRVERFPHVYANELMLRKTMHQLHIPQSDEFVRKTLDFARNVKDLNKKLVAK